MSLSDGKAKESQRELQLPRRDWVLLPVLGLFTIVFVALLMDLMARSLFPVFQADLGNCFVAGDPSGTAPAKPNSVCSERSAESSAAAEYRFNSRGDRDGELQPKQPGTIRIVMIGSSFAMGLYTPRDASFAALLPQGLSRVTGQRIELYNEAKGGKFRGGPYPIKNSVARFQEVLSAQPDMILWIITPMDIENSALESSPSSAGAQVGEEPEQANTTQVTKSPWNRLWQSVVGGTLWGKLRYRWEQSRSALVLEHELIALEGPNQYVDSYLKNDEDAEFLKTEPNAQWQALLKNFDAEAEGIEQQARDAGVPLVAVLLPNRAQAAMISTNAWPSGYDPYRLDNQLRAAIVSHGGTYIDILPEFRNSLDPEQYYMPVDGHLTVKGHQMIAQMLTAELIGGAAPLLKASASPRAAVRQGK